MDKFMDRFVLWTMVGLVVAVVYLTVDALIVFNSLDLPKIIGG